MAFVEELKNEYPKSYHYFELFYKENLEVELEFERFEKMNFMFQFGIMFQFFNSVSTDVDIFSNEEKALQESIKEAFAQYEEYLFLDS
jgi:hypothetical protein